MLVNWRRLLQVLWAATRSNQSILKEINPEYSLEGLILKLKLQYFGHLMWRANSLEKDPDAGKNWRQEKGTTEDEMVGWHHRFRGHEFEETAGDSEVREAWCAAVHGGHRESDVSERLNEPTKEQMCIGSFQTLNLSCKCQRFGALQRVTGTPGPLWRRTTCYMLQAHSAPGHSNLGTQADQAPGMWCPPSSLWPEGTRGSVFFFFFCFFSFFFFWASIYSISFELVYIVYHYLS